MWPAMARWQFSASTVTMVSSSPRSGSRVVGRTQRVLAMRAGIEGGLDRDIGMEEASPQPPLVSPARWPNRGGIGQVGLLAFRGRQAGVVRRLRRGSELGLEFGEACAQCTDLLRDTGH